jgi:hypothetical protein
MGWRQPIEGNCFRQGPADTFPHRTAVSPRLASKVSGLVHTLRDSTCRTNTLTSAIRARGRHASFRRERSEDAGPVHRIFLFRIVADLPCSGWPGALARPMRSPPAC